MAELAGSKKQSQLSISSSSLKSLGRALTETLVFRSTLLSMVLLQTPTIQMLPQKSRYEEAIKLDSNYQDLLTRQKGWPKLDRFNHTTDQGFISKLSAATVAANRAALAAINQLPTPIQSDMSESELFPASLSAPPPTTTPTSIPARRLHGVLHELPMLYLAIIDTRWAELNKSQDLTSVVLNYTELPLELFTGKTQLQRLLAHQQHLDEMLIEIEGYLGAKPGNLSYAQTFSQWQGPLGKPPSGPFAPQKRVL